MELKIKYQRHKAIFSLMTCVQIKTCNELIMFLLLSPFIIGKVHWCVTMYNGVLQKCVKREIQSGLVLIFQLNRGH